MDRREKLEFLLEQMRLCLAKDDYIRTQIISKKINIKSFEDEASHVNFNNCRITRGRRTALQYFELIHSNRKIQ
jgi:hypothetical protein